MSRPSARAGANVSVWGRVEHNKAVVTISPCVHLREPLLAQASVCLPRQAACLGKALGNGLGKLLAWARAGQAVWGKQKRSG